MCIRDRICVVDLRGDGRPCKQLLAFPDLGPQNSVQVPKFVVFFAEISINDITSMLQSFVLSKSFQRQSCTAINYLSNGINIWAGDFSVPIKFWPTDRHQPPTGRTRVFENEWLISAMFTDSCGRVLPNYWLSSAYCYLLTTHNRQKMTEKHRSVNNILWRVVAGRIKRGRGPDAARRPPVGHPWHIRRISVCYAGTRLSLAAHSIVPSGAIISAYIRDACWQTQEFS